MKAYITSVVLTSVLIALSELILPHGRLKVVVNTVFSIVLLISMLTPLRSNNIDFDLPVFNNQSSVTDYNNQDVQSYFNDRISEYYQEKFSSELKRNNLIAERVEVEICNMEIIKVQIFLSNLVIPENNEHININVIQNYVAKIIGVDAEKVVAYA